MIVIAICRFLAFEKSRFIIKIISIHDFRMVHFFQGIHTTTELGGNLAFHTATSVMAVLFDKPGNMMEWTWSCPKQLCYY